MIEGGEKMLIKGKSRGDAIGYRRRSSQSFVAGGYGWSSVYIVHVVHVVVRRPSSSLVCPDTECFTGEN